MKTTFGQLRPSTKFILIPDSEQDQDIGEYASRYFALIMKMEPISPDPDGPNAVCLSTGKQRHFSNDQEVVVVCLDVL